MNQQRATEGKRSGERRPSPAQPSCPGPRAQDPSNACCTGGCAGSGRQSQVQFRQAGRQAGVQALQIRHAGAASEIREGLALHAQA